MPLAALFSCGAPTASVLPSLLTADELPACPVSVPPQPKCASSTGLDALRYASCLSAPPPEDTAAGCALAYAIAPSTAVVNTVAMTADRMRTVMASPD